MLFAESKTIKKLLKNNEQKNFEANNLENKRIIFNQKKGSESKI